MDQALRDAARAALTELLHDGSPVVRLETIDEIVDVGWRRWTSFERRKRFRRVDPDVRVVDLAKGLRDAFEQEPRLAGPLMDDYRFLARTLCDAFAVGPDES